MDNLTEVKEIWQEVLKKLEAEVGFAEVDLWLRPIKPLLIESGTLKIEVPNSTIYGTVKQRYEEKILKIAGEITGKTIALNYSMSIAPAETKPAPLPEPPPEKRPASMNQVSFNPNYTFETFVVGASNRFAYALAESVAKTPGQTNPFFIYSAPGLGKTHLLHAIAHGIFKNNPSAKILYTASENFVNEYIDAIGSKSTENFRKKYRNLDCLLLDDIQFLVDKEKSEEEFFNTFNTLADSKKQIIVTCDRPPRELAFNQRLVSRFLSAGLADIKNPDFETRVAILRQKRDFHKYDIPDDIITFIAENVRKNIRELEGCLINVGSFFTSMKIPPTIDAVKGIIKDHITDSDQEENKIEIELIKTVVGEKFNVEAKDFNSKKKTEAIAFPRQIAMYLACELTDMSLPDIGEAFSRDHTTVMYARDKIRQRLHTDPYFSETVNAIISRLKVVNNSGKTR
ncbi:MAG: chromosomal replication initiator protein DnaA [Elusimicrobia bacterium]|nr:chromosomal replication initiator protein DnaA [Elusimicrobiota bacterium]